MSNPSNECVEMDACCRKSDPVYADLTGDEAVWERGGGGGGESGGGEVES